jgi:SNF2 family DNA or RNA helicase
MTLETAIEKGQLAIAQRPHQQPIIDECMPRKSLGLSVPMGQGKTLISIMIALMRKHLRSHVEPILVIASKSLIGSWKTEVSKFFGTELPFQVINDNPKTFTIHKDTIIVFVTAETAAKVYKDNQIHERAVIKETYFDPVNRYPVVKNIYNVPDVPYLKNAVGSSLIFQVYWSSLIIDEGHAYTNILTGVCQALIAICSYYRMILSGTMFDEPKFERILGYYRMLHWPRFPSNLPDAIEFMKSPMFKGTKETIVERPPIPLEGVKINKHIISHNLSPEEGQIYVSMKRTLQILKDYCRRSVRKEDRKRFSTYLLAMITYIRQSVVIPILPIANITLEMSELNDIRSELTVILMNQFNSLQLHDFLNDEESAKSTRIKEVIKILQKHNKPTDKIVLFSCFCTSLDMVEYYVNEEIPIDIYRIESKLSINARGKLIDECRESNENSVLLTTYELGAEGLNLQFANVVIILDFWWNSAKINQALARLLRDGQRASEVDIYFMTSNTGIEKSLFAKQQDKLILLDEIKNGKIKSSVKTLRMEEILKLIDANENQEFLNRTYM